MHSIQIPEHAGTASYYDSNSVLVVSTEQVQTPHKSSLACMCMNWKTDGFLVAGIDRLCEAKSGRKVEVEGRERDRNGDGRGFLNVGLFPLTSNLFYPTLLLF